MECPALKPESDWVSRKQGNIYIYIHTHTYIQLVFVELRVEVFGGRRDFEFSYEGTII